MTAMTASAVSHRSVQGSNGFAEEKRGTWLKDAGAAPTVIQHQLGHADPRLAFELYVMSIPGERRKQSSAYPLNSNAYWTQIVPIAPQ